MPRIRRSPDSAFLMTPEQYLRQAASLRASGNEQLAQRFENLYKLRMTARNKEAAGPQLDSPSIVPNARA